uniref:Uncharacterized protein n=1 Tax=Tetranychus urticae TaxID=32264 RepID=T1K8T1_TETUR
MSQNKAVRTMTKAEFIAENHAKYAVKYNFLPLKQLKGKLEEDWRKMYGPNKGKQRTAKPSIVPKVKIIPVDPPKNEEKPTLEKTPEAPDKKKQAGNEQNYVDQKKNKKERLETTIELLSDDNKSVGFIECRGNATFLKLPNGQTVPWSHSTPIRLTRNNTHLKDITRLPFSPI